MNATCFVSTGDYQSDFDRYFRDRNVVVVLDNDSGGEKGISAAAQLNGIAASVKVLRLPNSEAKWGLDDWIQANKNDWKMKLRRLVQSTEEYVPPSEQVAAVAQKRTSEQLEADKVSNFRKLAEDEIVPLPLSEITTHLNSTTGGWPKVCAGRLFHYSEASDRIRTMLKTSQLFAWVGETTGIPPVFALSSDCHNKAEFFDHLIETQEQVDAIEFTPHEPPVNSVFYAHRQLPETNGQHFDWLLNCFSAATDDDRSLIASLFLTPAWGGPAGDRPIFLITADGHGAGKSTLAKIVTELFGGAIDVQPTEKTKELKERLLSPEGRKSRLCVIDNLKGFRVSSAELEAMITATRISGREMYVGESSRPNLLTWIMTSNSPGLSRDLAQRVVNIRLKRATNSATWASGTFAYVREHRWEIIADIIGILRSPRGKLSRYSRWATWESAVLSRLPGAETLQDIIRERQSELDCDGEESGDIDAFIESKLDALKYDTEQDVIFIPGLIIADWYSIATGEKCSTTKATRSINRNITDGLTERLKSHRTEKQRGFLWVGKNSGHVLNPRSDIETRIQHQKSRESWSR